MNEAVVFIHSLTAFLSVTQHTYRRRSLVKQTNQLRAMHYRKHREIGLSVLCISLIFDCECEAINQISLICHICVALD